jgi:hypothetical protein
LDLVAMAPLALNLRSRRERHSTSFPFKGRIQMIQFSRNTAVFAAATTIALSTLFSAGAAVAGVKFVVSYEAEAAGVQNTTATFSVGGVETFESLSVHGYPQSFTTHFGTSGGGSTINGTYTAGNAKGIQINAADQYGGAGGAGKYIAAFQNTPYSLTLSSDVPGGVNYFGYWLSALDKGNYVTFYGSNGEKLFTFDPSDVIKAVNLSANPSLYYGNPNSAFKGKDKSEPFIFLNFFDTNGTFSKIVFNEVNFGGGYESDNHTVGHYVTMGQGTQVKLIQSVAGVPEPATWAMMLVGFAALGFAGYRRNKAATLAA